MNQEIPRSAVHSIMVVGRRWFAKTYGNTYHSAEIYVNGKMVHKIECAYGYGSQYEWNAGSWLEANGYIEREGYPNGGSQSMYSYCHDHAITYSETVTDVTRKKDL